MNTEKKISAKRRRVYQIAFLGVMIALSIALIFLVHFPIFPAVAFLEYDPGDITIIISTTVFGPIAGLIVTVAASLIQGITVSAQSGVYGIIMHIIATGSYVLAYGLINRRNGDLVRQIIAAVAGTLCMTVMMFFANMLITPHFMGAPLSMVMDLMPFILLFNLVKAAINSVFAVIIYRALHRFIKI